MLSVLQVWFPGTESDVETALRNSFTPADPGAFAASYMGCGPPPPGLFHSYRRAPDYLVLFMINGSLLAPSRSCAVRTLVDIHIEDAHGGIFKWTEQVWAHLRNGAAAGGRKGQGLGASALELAEVRCPTTKEAVATGAIKSTNQVLMGSDFRTPTFAGLIAALVSFTVVFLLPAAQRPTLWWVLAPFAITLAATYISARVESRSKRITWRTDE